MRRARSGERLPRASLGMSLRGGLATEGREGEKLTGEPRGPSYDALGLRVRREGDHGSPNVEERPAVEGGVGVGRRERGLERPGDGVGIREARPSDPGGVELRAADR